MTSLIKILILEDLPTDAVLAEREIRKVLPSVKFQRVENRGDFIQALDEFQPDLIVSDYQMPAFDGMSALKISLEKTPLTPFIIHTGSMNEDTAVECMKAGATDYVIKEHIKRLGPAVKNALENKEINMERIKAHQALVESENRFRRLAENADDLIYRYEFVPERRFAYVSPSAIKLTGYTPEEHYADPDLGFKLVHPDDVVMLQTLSEAKTDEPISLVLRWVKKDGQVIWTEQRNVPVFEENNRLIAIEGIARDITQRITTEEKLKHNEQLLRFAGKLARLGGWQVDILANKLFWSDEVADIHEMPHGYSPTVEEGINFYAPESRSKIIEVYTACATKGIPYDEELKILTGTGKSLWVRTIGMAQKDDTGKVIKIQGAFQDITERKLFEQKLQLALEKAEESDKLKSAFLANMSHEVRTPMNGILGFAQLLKQPNLTGNQQQKYIEIIEKSGKRMLNIISDLLDISRIESGQVEIYHNRFCLNEEMNDLYDFFATDLKRNSNMGLFMTIPDKKVHIVSDR